MPTFGVVLRLNNAYQTTALNTSKGKNYRPDLRGYYVTLKILIEGPSLSRQDDGLVKYLK